MIIRNCPRVDDRALVRIFENVPDLKAVWLDYVNAKSATIEALSKLKLKALALVDLPTKQALPTVGKIKTLQFLYLRLRHIKGDGIERLNHLTSLQHLIIDCKKIGGSQLAKLSLPKTTDVHIHFHGKCQNLKHGTSYRWETTRKRTETNADGSKKTTETKTRVPVPYTYCDSTTDRCLKYFTKHFAS